VIGSEEKVQKEAPEVGLIVTLVVRIRRQAERNVVPAEDPVARSDQNIRSADPHQQLVVRKVTTVKNQRQVKKDENN